MLLGPYPAGPIGPKDGPRGGFILGLIPMPGGPPGETREIGVN